MYQPVQGKNQNLFYANYGAVAQNNNIMLGNNLNNPVQYKIQTNPQQQNAQRNQHVHNYQLAQPQNIQNKQILNATNIQVLNMQNNPNIKNVQNVHKYQPNQNQTNNQYIQQPNINIIPKQVVLRQDNVKVNNHPQSHQANFQVNNPLVVTQLPPNVYQQQQLNPNNQKLRAQKKTQALLASSYNNFGEAPTLEPIQDIKKENAHYYDQNQRLQKQVHQKIEQNLQKAHQADNLKNTTFEPNLLTNNQVNQNNQNNNQNKGDKNIQQNTHNDNLKKSATLMTVNSLVNLDYRGFPQVEFSTKPFFNIAAYGSNSYNGKIKSYNEDMNKNIVNYQKEYVVNNKTYTPHISYFGVFDGHGGDKCSKFLKENFDNILFQSPHFFNNIIESIRAAFQNAENQFREIAIQNGKLVDRSGSCALVALIINDILYAINLGDSRALYSRNGGKEYYQITRDHKPNDEREKRRIEKAGGKVYYANKAIVNGKEVVYKEEQFGKGFTFPYRLSPSGLAVSFYYITNI